jgi:hypothetical protein
MQVGIIEKRRSLERCGDLDGIATWRKIRSENYLRWWHQLKE